MGQRLEICITDGENELANAYYHWSAYTESAIELSKQIITDYYCRRARSKDYLKKAITLLELTDAGVTDNEKAWLKQDKRFKNYKFGGCLGRNQGLIAVSPEGMKETRDWQEGQVFIDIKNEVIQFDVWSYWNLDEIKEWYPEEQDKIVSIDKMPNEWMSFDEFMEFASKYDDGVFYKYGDLYFRGIA